MIDRRKANRDWTPAEPDGNVPTWERVQLAVLMDIRDELRRLRGTFECQNFLRIPALVRRISANTAKPRKKKKG